MTAEQRGPAYDDLRGFLDLCRESGELRCVSGAHWNLEIGAILELMAERRGPALVFDRIPDHPADFRLAVNLFASLRRTAFVLGLPPDETSGVRLLDLWRQKVRGAGRIPPLTVDGGPLLENVRRGPDVDLGLFPAPVWHPRDGGRYLGTACCVFTRDPDTGSVNVGVYRCMVQGRDRLSVKLNKGKDGRINMEKWHARGEPCPVAITFGQDPRLYLASFLPLPSGASELDFAGWLRGAPVRVLSGEVTGLPLPAAAEIAVEGFIPPLDGSELPREGPFGEWPGYYADATSHEVPLLTVERLYHRDAPILHGAPPMKPPRVAEGLAIPTAAVDLWDALEKAGVPDVRGVWGFAGDTVLGFFTVIAIRQRYAGHAKQAALACIGSRAGCYGGRFVVVVDDDVDITDAQEVLWAIGTRCDARTGVDRVQGVWTTPADPVLSPEDRALQRYASDRVIIDACRPFVWRDEFPAVCGFDAEFRRRIVGKWTDLFPPAAGG